jgi:LacI family transcriptional regulator
VPTKRTRIREVAERAGVSTGTVSNVLNHPASVSEATRNHILRVMAEMNFVRDASARQLRVGHSQTVGVIVRDMSNPYYMELARGIADRLDQDNCIMMLCSSDEDPGREARFVGLFAEQGVRGMLITPFRDSSDQIDRLQGLHIPTVLLDATSTHTASVGVDHLAGAEQAVRHLLDQGHRLIGFINGPASLRPCQERAAGARRAIAAAGLDPDTALVSTEVAVMNADSGRQAMDALLDRAAVTAVFCVNDFVAMGAMRGLRARGLSVPRDVAVVGYDDIVFAGELMVPLTSVRQPMRQLGWTAVEMLLNPAGQPRHVSFEPHLVIRESSAG